MKRKILSILLALTMLLSVAPLQASADASKIVTMGADLTKEQEQTVLDFFGISDTSSVEMITINNQMEREVLSGKIPDAQIGTKTYSCAYIEPTNSGGINVRTANLTYISDATLANALMTAGIENCNVIVTAPMQVSGTGALTGVYKAYESIGVDLDLDKQDLAAEELIVASDLEEAYGGDVNELMKDVKSAVAASEDMSDDEIRDIVREKADEYNISLSEADIDKLLAILKRLQGMDYSFEDFQTSVNAALDVITGSNGAAKAGGFFKSIADFFKNLFGGSKASSGGSIFDNVNTDIFKFDKN